MTPSGFTVPATTEEFQEAFLSTPNSTPPPTRTIDNPFAELQDADTDRMRQGDILTWLIDAVNSNGLAPDSVFYIHSAQGDSIVDSSPAIFRLEHTARKEKLYPCDVAVPVEVFAHSGGIDPFDNADDKASEQSRKQLFEHISAKVDVLFRAQRRFWVLMLLVIGRKFRCLAWDRTGVVVTPAVDYFEHPDSLCNVLWDISQLDDVALGHDPRQTCLRPRDAKGTCTCILCGKPQ